MNKKIPLILTVVAILLIAGYFILFNSSTTLRSSNSLTYKEEVSTLVLSLEELPSGYKIIERTPRLESDVSEEGLSLGWKEGYYVRYLKGDENSLLTDLSVLELFVSRYPLENISSMITEEPEDMGDGYVSEVLPNFNVGEKSKSTRYREENGLTYYRIEFYKKDILINIFMSGTSTDYEFIKDLASKTASKI